MPSAESLSLIGSEGRKILELARRDPGREVPQYPGWTLHDLLRHLGTVHERTVLVCRELPTERIKAPGPPDDVDVFEWYQETLESMVTALGEVEIGESVWTFIPGGGTESWITRMLVETGVHRWDADQAMGTVRPLLDEVAEAGLDEFARMWLPRLGSLPRLELDATDLGRSWVFGESQPTTRVEATASDLFLGLMSRGGADLPPEWVTALESLSTPSKA